MKKKTRHLEKFLTMLAKHDLDGYVETYAGDVIITIPGIEGVLWEFDKKEAELAQDNE